MKTKLLFTTFFLLQLITLKAQTTLVSGDMAIIGFNYDANPKELAIVTLVDIAIGTNIRITDYGYDEAGGFGVNSTTTLPSSTSEGSISWTTTAPIVAGTVFKIGLPTGTTPSVTGLPGTVSYVGWTNTTNTTSPSPAGGDNWFIFQGSSATSISQFVFGWTNPFATTFNSINQPAAQFIVSGSGTPNNGNSYLPPSLNLSTSAIALNRDTASGGYHGDNNVYNGIKTGTKAQILTEICKHVNWSINETATYDLNVGGTYFPGVNPVFTVNTMGVEDNEFNSFVLFPNPTNNNFNVKLINELSVNEAKISLFDINGRKLFEQNLKNIETLISFESIQSGTYFIEVSIGDNKTIKRIIKN